MDEKRQQQTPIFKNQNKVQFFALKQGNEAYSIQSQIPELSQKTSHNIECQNGQANLPITQGDSNIKKRLDRFIRFIEFHTVQPESIWTKKKQMPITQFSTRINQNYGYYFSNDQLSALLSICSKKNIIESKDLAQIGIWNEERTLINFKKYAQESHHQKPCNGKRQSIKPVKKQQKRFQGEQNISPQISNGFQSIKQSKMNQKSSQFNFDGFKQVKKYSQAKVRHKMEQLKKDIKQSVLQKKWDFIVMAGEMNQWIEQQHMLQAKLPQSKQSQLKQSQLKPSESRFQQSLKSLRFKVINSDPVQIIQQNIYLNSEQSIPHVVFLKKYETLKKKAVKQLNNKNNLKGTVLMVLQENEKFSKNNLHNRINQRDQQLNFVLLQVVRMKSLFQWQNTILKDADINS